MSGLTDRVLSLFLCFCKVQDSSKCDTDYQIFWLSDFLVSLGYHFLLHMVLCYMGFAMQELRFYVPGQNNTKQMLSYKKHAYM